MAAACGAGGSKRSVADHRGVHGSTEEVVAPADLDGTPIELLLRDQKPWPAGTRNGHSTTVVAAGSGSTGNRLGDVLAVSGSGS